MRTYTPPPVPASLWQKPLHFIAFGFGSGAMPWAPGTFGTLIAIPFYLVLTSLSHAVYLCLLLPIIAGSVLICDRVSRETNTHDHQGMCLDEIVGFLVAMAGAPTGILWITAGFILFRLFDIWKPWPISWMDEHISGGAGMILDDVAAGILTAVILNAAALLA